MSVYCLPCCAVLSAAAVVRLQAEERAEKEAQRQMEKDARNREREEAKKMARYPIEDTEVRPSLSLKHFGSPAGTVIFGRCMYCGNSHFDSPQNDCCRHTCTLMRPF